MSLRKALLVGINAYPNAPLRGCINDVQQVKGLLKQYYGFRDDDIKVLLDGQATGAGIQAGLAWLAEGDGGPEAVRIFHYSGHGSYVADQNGDELDGRDECLVPFDYETNGMLTDDVLKVIYDRFPEGGNLSLVMDSCHSGTVNRLPFVDPDITSRFLEPSPEVTARSNEAAVAFMQKQYLEVLEKLETLRDRELTADEQRGIIEWLISFFSKKHFGDVRTKETNVLLAGCSPDQTSADAYIGGDYHGAFTYNLGQTIQEAQGQLSYRQLIQRTGDKLKAGYTQIPQLEYPGQRDQALAFRPFAA